MSGASNPACHFSLKQGLLFIVDGCSGLNKALNDKYQCHDRKLRRAIRIRCHIHKWWNIEKALGDAAHKASGPFWALRDAKDMAEAKVLSDRLERILRDSNLSALESYREAKDDLLAIHELKLSRNLKRFFSTTNAIERLNLLIQEDMRRVKNWHDLEHFQRWLATYCLASEKRMRRMRGHAGLPALWVVLFGAILIMVSGMLRPLFRSSWDPFIVMSLWSFKFN
jgi:transposase-like protein